MRAWEMDRKSGDGEKGSGGKPGDLKSEWNWKTQESHFCRTRREANFQHKQKIRIWIEGITGNGHAKWNIQEDDQLETQERSWEKNVTWVEDAPQLIAVSWAQVSTWIHGEGWGQHCRSTSLRWGGMRSRTAECRVTGARTHFEKEKREVLEKLRRQRSCY